MPTGPTQVSMPDGSTQVTKKGKKSKSKLADYIAYLEGVKDEHYCLACWAEQLESYLTTYLKSI